MLLDALPRCCSTRCPTRFPTFCSDMLLDALTTRDSSRARETGPPGNVST
jgi:hypothetical protein